MQGFRVRRINAFEESRGSMRMTEIELNRKGSIRVVSLRILVGRSENGNERRRERDRDAKMGENGREREEQAWRDRDIETKRDPAESEKEGIKRKKGTQKSAS